MIRLSLCCLCFVASLIPAFAQETDLSAMLKQAAPTGPVSGAGDVLPKQVQAPQASAEELKALDIRERQEKSLEGEIRALKAKEKGPKRFAADLFDVRFAAPQGTEGGIADDYVLGVGDQVQINVFGSATFEVPAKVDGRGELLIPKVGMVKVAGMSLGKARNAVQAKVAQNFSRSTVDLSVTKLREVRVFLLGEVYRPGGYLVPSLSSLVNVLGLAGGPTAVGSFRQVRVMRGGKVIHTVDLYPLRAEGLGNVNFGFQSGDIVFVPLMLNAVKLEGGFVRVQGGESARSAKEEVKAAKILEQATGADKVNFKLTPSVTRAEMAGLASPSEEEARDILPLVQFELLPGETALDVVRFAGGLVPEAYADSLSLRHQDGEGLTSVRDISFASLGATNLEKGDVLSAYPRRDRATRVVSVVGWARVPGSFGRQEGLRVGDLLQRDRQVLPDTYLGRGEIVRTGEDGTTKYLAFDVGKALTGDPAHNLLLENRDRVELVQLNRMRLPRQVLISGPLSSPGAFELHEGMRVADLVFKGGILLKHANRFYAELARYKDGKISETLRLDLGRLASTEVGSPLHLEDEAINPMLRDDDHVTVYEKPQFKIHRKVTIQGQVARPGTYVVDAENFTLSQLLERAGGVTPEAMPAAGIFLRSLGGEGLDITKGLAGANLGVAEIMQRLNETKLIANSAAKPTTGDQGQLQLFRPPVLHGLNLSGENRLVVDFEKALQKDKASDIEVQDGDTVIIPRRTNTVLVLGEAATPFALYHVTPGMSVSDLLKRAGGTTRNADTWNLRLLRADGRIVDRWVGWAKVQPGDSLIIPQRIRRDSTWQENLAALTPLALLINAFR